VLDWTYVLLHMNVIWKRPTACDLSDTGRAAEGSGVQRTS